MNTEPMNTEPMTKEDWVNKWRQAQDAANKAPKSKKADAQVTADAIWQEAYDAIVAIWKAEGEAQ